MTSLGAHLPFEVAPFGSDTLRRTFLFGQTHPIRWPSKRGNAAPPVLHLQWRCVLAADYSTQLHSAQLSTQVRSGPQQQT